MGVCLCVLQNFLNVCSCLIVHVSAHTCVPYGMCMYVCVCVCLLVHVYLIVCVCVCVHLGNQTELPADVSACELSPSGTCTQRICINHLPHDVCVRVSL